MPGIVKLDIVQGPTGGKSFVCEEHEMFLFGRSGKCQACLRDDPNLSEKHVAIALYEKPIETYEHLLHQECRTELASDLGWSYMSKFISVSDLGGHRTAMTLFNRDTVRSRGVLSASRR